MFTVFVVLLFICVRESSAYVNSYGNDFNPSDSCVYVFYNVLATASNCSVRNVVALLCITSDGAGLFKW